MFKFKKNIYYLKLGKNMKKIISVTVLALFVAVGTSLACNCGCKDKKVKPTAGCSSCSGCSEKSAAKSSCSVKSACSAKSSCCGSCK